MDTRPSQAWTCAAVFGLVLAACSSGTPASQPCAKDIDCKGARICVAGMCTDIDAASPEGGPGDGGAVVDAPGTDATTDGTAPVGDGSQPRADSAGTMADGADDSSLASDSSQAAGDGGPSSDAPGGPPSDAGPNPALQCATCPAGQTFCAGGCIPSQSTEFDCTSPCGTCALPHALSTCNGSACAVASCEPGWADCNHVVSDGCEADLHSAATCGTCGTGCSGATPLCGAGGCVASCTPPASQCNDRCTDLSTDPYNCGSCTPCKATGGFPTCAGGTCGVSCPPGTSDCSSSGVCERLDGPTHCGSCGKNCPAPASGAAPSGFAICTGGQCGMACQPGWTLSGSTCKPPVPQSTTLAMGGAAFAGLALDANNVYWVDSSAGTVSAVPKAGGTAVILATNQSKPLDVAVDDTYAYWSDNLGGAIMRAPKDGSGSPSVVVAVTNPTDIGVIGDSVYWRQGGAIEGAPKVGGGVGTPIGAIGLDASPSIPQAQSFASNGTFILTFVSNELSDENWDVIDPSSGGVVSQTNPGAVMAFAGAIDATDIYYTTGVNCPGIAWTSLPGVAGANGRVSTTPNMLCGSAGLPTLVAGNRCSAFWNSNAGSPEVSMMSKAPGITFPVPLTPGPATSLAADDTSLFVATATAITRVDLP